MVSAPSTRKRRRAEAAAARRAARGGRPAPIVLAVLALGVLAVLVLGALGLRAWLADPLTRGQQAMEMRDWRAARVDLMNAVAEAPNNVRRRMLLAETLIALGRGRDAESQLRYLAERGVPGARLRARIAEAEALQGKDEEALVTLASGPVIAADQGRAARTAGEVNYRLGRYDAATTAYATAIRVAGDEPATWIAQARWRLAEQDMLGADTAATRAVALAPGDVRAHMIKAMVVRTRGGPVPALPWFEAALAVDSRDLLTLTEYAATLGEAGRYRAMIGPLSQAAEIAPDNSRVLFLQSVVAARGGQPTLARTYLARITGRDADLPAVLMVRAAVELTLGAPTAAVGYADRLVTQQPDNDRARRLLAAALLAADNPRGAIVAIDAITIRPDADSWSLLLLGRAFGAMDWQVDAVHPLDRAARLAPGDAPPLAAPAATGNPLDPAVAVPNIRALIAANDAIGAQRLAAQLAAANPGVQQARVLLGDARLATGDAMGAAAEYRAAADLRFDETVLLRLVNVLLRSDDRTGAGAAIGAFLARNPENVAVMRVAAAWSAEGGDWPGALLSLRAAIDRTGPNDALLLAQLARAEVEAGEAARAVPHAARAYRLLPGNATVCGVYGLTVLRSGGERRIARELLDKAVGLAPDDALLSQWQREAMQRAN